MKNNIIKVLITTILLIFYVNITVTLATSTPTTEFYGEIGDWDPTNTISPNFDNVDLDGSKPTTGDYFTISVTVPIDMNFAVLRNNTSAFGEFYSPNYKIINNGSKTITATVNNFSKTSAGINGYNDLFIEEPVSGDKKLQMKLSLDYTHDSSSSKKVVDLTNFNNNTPVSLGDIELNGTSTLTFKSNEWEVPEGENQTDNAMSNFNLGFSFSNK